MRHFELFSNTVPMNLLHFQGFQFLLFLYFRCEYESPISTLVWFRVHKTLIKLWPVATVLVATSKTLANLKTKSPKLRPRGQKVTARCQWNNWRLMSCPEVIIQQLTRLWMHYYYYWPSLQYLAIDNEKPKNHHPKIYLNYTPSPLLIMNVKEKSMPIKIAPINPDPFNFENWARGPRTTLKWLKMVS